MLCPYFLLEKKSEAKIQFLNKLLFQWAGEIFPLIGISTWLNIPKKNNFVFFKYPLIPIIKYLIYQIK